jgi:hypothetical protein
MKIKNISIKNKEIIQQYLNIVNSLNKPIEFKEMYTQLGFTTDKQLKNILMLNRINHLNIMNDKFPKYCKICNTKLTNWRSTYCGKSCASSDRTVSQKYINDNINKIHKNIVILEEIKFKNKKILCKCLKCGRIFKACFGYLTLGHGCNHCSHENINARSLEEFKQIIFKKLPDFELLDKEYIARKKSIIKCKKCNNIQDVRKNRLISGKHKCQVCDSKVKSFPERQIERFLLDNNINYKYQKSFKTLKGKTGKNGARPLKFDFYLPDYNLCVEYDGQSHYNKDCIYNKFGIIDDTNDLKKDNYCKIHNINLLRIPYWKQNIMLDILDRYIKNIKNFNFLITNNRLTGNILR